MSKIALDVGDVRIGMAASQGQLVLPVEAFQNTDPGLFELYQELEHRRPEVIYVGLPLSLSGSHTASTTKAIEFAKTLVAKGFVVRMIDERLTTRSAQQLLRQAGKNAKSSKTMIDAQAAAGILEFAIQSERNGLAGISLEELDA
jgi:putative Holliday junction resolvase